MKIRKFLHSCIFIEHGDSSILIDPGEFSFIEGKFAPADIPAADAVFLTHEHSDHYFPSALTVITGKRKSRIVTNGSVATLLAKEGISAEVLAPGQTTVVGSFSIEAIEAPHGTLPVSVPENVGYFINGTVFHPGDSLTFTLSKNPKVLLLPITAPWLAMANAVETALRIKPEIAVPIHDAIMKDFMLARIYGLAERILRGAGIEFRPLAPGETLEV